MYHIKKYTDISTLKTIKTTFEFQITIEESQNKKPKNSLSKMKMYDIEATLTIRRVTVIPLYAMPSSEKMICDWQIYFFKNQLFKEYIYKCLSMFLCIIFIISSI